MAKSDEKPADEAAPVVEAVVEAPRLGRASESGDAGVHNLLAQRGIHAANDDTEKVADVDRQLAEMGYAV